MQELKFDSLFLVISLEMKKNDLEIKRKRSNFIECALSGVVSGVRSLQLELNSDDR